jgi:hypothetical protein
VSIFSYNARHGGALPLQGKAGEVCNSCAPLFPGDIVLGLLPFLYPPREGPSEMRESPDQEKFSWTPPAPPASVPGADRVLVHGPYALTLS